MREGYSREKSREAKTPSGIGELIPGLPSIGQQDKHRQILGYVDRELLEFLRLLAAEHAQMKGERLNDPKFERYYRKHLTFFLDEIERSYLRKLLAGTISKDDFSLAMKDYVHSHRAGSEEEKREDEADHIEYHVLAQLARELRIGNNRASRQLRDYNHPDEVRTRLRRQRRPEWMTVEQWATQVLGEPLPHGEKSDSKEPEEVGPQKSEQRKPEREE